MIKKGFIIFCTIVLIIFNFGIKNTGAQFYDTGYGIVGVNPLGGFTSTEPASNIGSFGLAGFGNTTIPGLGGITWGVTTGLGSLGSLGYPPYGSLIGGTTIPGLGGTTWGTTIGLGSLGSPGYPPYGGYPAYGGLIGGTTIPGLGGTTWGTTIGLGSLGSPGYPHYGGLIGGTTIPGLGGTTWGTTIGLGSLGSFGYPHYGGLIGGINWGGVGGTHGHEVNRPDLLIRTASVQPIPVLPGETLIVKAIAGNKGKAAARNVQIMACDEDDWCGTEIIEYIAPSEEATAVIQITAKPEHLKTNPHFFTITIDPDRRICETNERNNYFQPKKPTFVVNLEPIDQILEEEHDDIIEIRNGIAINYDSILYGDNGAPFESMQIDDPNKRDAILNEPSESDVPEQPRIDPNVVKADIAAKSWEKLRYIVKYSHNVPMPRLPDLIDKDDRFSERNIAVLEKRMGMFEAVRRARISRADNLIEQVKAGGGRILEYFTLSGSILVEAPKGMLEFFSSDETVLHVESEIGGERPPADISDGRDLIDSDPYFNGGATGKGFIALLDTGIRESHTLLSSPSHFWFVEDCVNGNSYCNDDGDPDYDPDDDCWDHGTSTAAIITGNNNLGNGYRGVTSSWVDSWKVYPENCGGLSVTAVHRGYDQAVLWGDKIIVAEMQSGQGPTGSIADDADNAFDAGSVTIAANGNNGPGSGTVNSPANAHKALGIGNYDADTLGAISSQSRGPTSDCRYKPDIQAPTNTDSASTISNTAVNNFGGTSGATPYAAGAASVFADWFGLTSLSTAAAGKIYAGLINGGPKDWCNFSNDTGVGKFSLPLNGMLYYGSRNVTHHDNDYVNIYVPSNTSKISATIWWGENPGNIHRDIDLYLKRPDGSTSANSLSIPSVFEHIVVNSPIVPGTRQVRIYGYSVPLFKTVTVYYAIHVKYL